MLIAYSLGGIIVLSVGFFFMIASYVIFSFLCLWTSQNRIGSGKLVHPGFSRLIMEKVIGLKQLQLLRSCW